MVGVPGPIDCPTEVAIPAGTAVPPEALGMVVLHNDTVTDERKVWPWERAQAFARSFPAGELVALGKPGPPLPGAVDLRGRTTLAEAAAVIQSCRCYVGIDSGLMWIAGSLQVPTVGLYTDAYIPNASAVQPLNSNATYLVQSGSLDGVSEERVRVEVVRRC